MEEILLYFSLLHQGDWQRIYHSIETKEPVDYERLKTLKQTYPHQYLTILSPDYPLEFKQAECPPYVLYYRGDRSLLHAKKKIAVIGSRRSSEYGETMTRNIVADLCKKGWVIVSGLAKGIDATAHRECLKQGGKTIAVIGGGINTIYPLENKDLYEEIERSGLIISEYPADTKARREAFPFRNRLIAALSQGVAIMEASARSGTLITTRFALEQGKDIFCVPQLATSDSACNTLIQQGAKLIVSALDILEEYE